MKTKDVAYIALFTALTAAGAFIRIPIPIVPFTLQFLFTNLAGLLLGGWKGAASVGCYVALGLIGLPIFTGGGGIFYVLEPTFGYLLGFVAGSFVTGFIAHKKARPSFLRLLLAGFAGLGVVYAMGIVYYGLICNLYLNSPIGIGALFLYCFVLAVPGDIALCVVAALTAQRTQAFIRRSEAKKGTLRALKQRIIAGGRAEREDVELLLRADLSELCAAADEIRAARCGNGFDLCSIINAKSGRCGEDCKFCAQSAKYGANAEHYPLLSAERIVKAAKRSCELGAVRFSVVTSGGKLSDGEVDALCESLRAVKRETAVSLCVSAGLMSKENFAKLKAAGAERAHCNLETSRAYFPNICSTHSYGDKIAALEAAREAGLGLCSGGIMGLGESFADRADMAFELRELGIKSVPINFLNPIKGTPLENAPPLSEEEKRRTVALFRFILPNASIRLAGGRALMPDGGKACFCAGANAAITGDMLTTAGISAEDDVAVLGGLGYEVKKDDE